MPPLRWTRTFTLKPQAERLVKLMLVHDRLPDETSAARFREAWGPILPPLMTFLESATPRPKQRPLAERGRPQGSFR